jgi:flagellar motor switch protein FliM
VAEPQAAEATGQAQPASSAISDEEVSALLDKTGSGAVRPYDFGSQRINHAQLPTLQTIGKSFAAAAAATLSGLLNRTVALEFGSIESARAADLQASLPVPASAAVIRLKPLAGFAFISVAPGLLLALLDAFYGGTGRPSADTQAAASPAAQRFLALVLKSLAADFAAAWTPVSALELEVVRQETNPRLLKLGGPQDAFTVVRFAGEFGAHAGSIDWLLPDALLEPLRESLASDGGKAPAKKQEAWAPALGASVHEIEVEVRAVLAEATISLRELVSLSPGDIIPIEPPTDVALLVGEVSLFQGRFGVSEGRNALKILPGGPA